LTLFSVAEAPAVDCASAVNVVSAPSDEVAVRAGPSGGE